MSHAATNWAFSQRGIGAITKVVLLHLADCHNPSGGCFPAQAWLADACEIHRATVNRHLDDLEARGLIRRETRQDPHTKRQLRTRYYLACEPAFATPLHVASHVAESDTALPGDEVADDSADDAEQPVDNSVENVPSRVAQTPDPVSHSCATVTCKELINPLTPNTADRFAAVRNSWPDRQRGNLQTAERLFAALSSEDQHLAQVTAGPTLLGFALLHRDPPTLGHYLSRTLFREFIDAPRIEDGRYDITPSRPEWSPWLGWIRDQHGEKHVQGIVKLGHWRPATRWPDAHPTSTPNR